MEVWLLIAVFSSSTVQIGGLPNSAACEKMATQIKEKLDASKAACFSFTVPTPQAAPPPK